MPQSPSAGLRRLFGFVLASSGLLALAAAPEEVRFDAAFEGGSIGTIERTGEGAYRLRVRGQQDEHGRNRQASWYFFRVDGAKGRDLSLVLADFVGEYNGKPGACPMGPEIVPVVSDDGEHWRPAPDVTWDDRAKEATLRVRPEGDSLWVAHQTPYTTTRRDALLDRVGRRAEARVEVIGRSARGRALHLVTVTDEAIPDRDKGAVWLMARQHAWESGTSFVMEGALLWATSDDPAARASRRRVVFTFVPMVDPDGSASGGVRFNAHGFDVNRHWDEVDLRRKVFLERMPEIWHVKKALVAHLDSGRRVDLMLNLHNTETAEYLSTMADDAGIRALVGGVSGRLTREAGFRPSQGPTFGVAPDGTANVLHAERGVPIVLMEQRIGRDPITGRPPSAEDRLAFGAKLARIMAEAVRP